MSGFCAVVLQSGPSHCSELWRASDQEESNGEEADEAFFCFKADHSIVFGYTIAFSQGLIQLW